MPPRPRQFALACALLLVLHGGAVGLLWTNAAPPVPEPTTVGQDADAEALLGAAEHNAAAFPSTTEVRIYHVSNGTTAARLRVAVEPATGRLHYRKLETGPGELPFYEEAFYTGWGSWVNRDGSWGYFSEPGRHGYEPGLARLVRPPAPENARSVRTTAHGNGTTTVALTAGYPYGYVMAFAGENASLTYRIAVRDGAPYFAGARATPADDDGLAVTVDRKRGATVDRPADVPRMGPDEALDRLLAGARYS